MPGMLHLCDVFQFIVYRLYNSPFPKKQSVRHAHQSAFHIAFQFSDKLYAIDKQALEKILADISFVRNQLTIDKSINALYSNGFLSSTSPGVIMKFSSSPFSLQIRCSLKPKNHPMEHLPLWAIPLNTLWTCILWFLHTLRGVLSTKLMPVHFPSNTFLMNSAKGTATSFQVPQNGCMIQPAGRDGAYAYRLFPVI